MSTTIERRAAEARIEAKCAVTSLMGLNSSMRPEIREAIVEGMFEAITREHRTLQQAFISNLQQILEKYSKTRTDGRNFNAVYWAKEVSKIPSAFPYV